MSASVINRIDKQLEQLDPEALRSKVLLALRQFRSSWVELGRLLTDVAYGGDYKEWGYEDFEVYCARELGLKKPTVKKLMVSYNYMKKYEPGRLEEGEAGDSFSATVPDYQTVELLHRARERDDIDDDEKDRMHRAAFTGEEDEGNLRKEIRGFLTDPSDENIDDANRARRQEMQDILRTARLLRKKLAHSKYVPGGMTERFEQLLVELESLD